MCEDEIILMKEELIKKLKRLNKLDDPEEAHELADELFARIFGNI